MIKQLIHSRLSLTVLLALLLIGCSSPGKYPKYGQANSAAEQFIDYSFRQQSNFSYCSAAIEIPSGVCYGCNIDQYMASSRVRYKVFFSCGQTVEGSNSAALQACELNRNPCAPAWVRNNQTGFIGSYKDNVSNHLSRRASIKLQQYREAAQKQMEGQDTNLCIKYGFKPNTQEFSSCRLQISLARQQMERIEAIESQQQAQYAQQLAAQKAAQDAAESQALFELSSRMLSGQSALGALSAIGSGQSFVPPPTQGRRVQTFRMPNGSMFTCARTGSFISCQ